MISKESSEPKPISKAKKTAKNKAKQISNVGLVSPKIETQELQTQSRKRKNSENPSSSKLNGSQNKSPKLEANINKDNLVSNQPATKKKNKSKTKKQGSLGPQNNEQSNLDSHINKLKKKPKGNGQLTKGASPNTVKPKTKKGKKKGKKNVQLQHSDIDHKSNCIEYLNKWNTDKDNWKFEKNVQVRLLSLVLEKEKIPKESFNIFLNYMENASDRSKTNLKSKANDVVLAMEKWENMSDEEKAKSTAPDKDNYKRARKILQHLA